MAQAGGVKESNILFSRLGKLGPVAGSLIHTEMLWQNQKPRGKVERKEVEVFGGA